MVSIRYFVPNYVMHIRIFNNGTVTLVGSYFSFTKPQFLSKHLSMDKIQPPVTIVTKINKIFQDLNQQGSFICIFCFIDRIRENINGGKICCQHHFYHPEDNAIIPVPHSSIYRSRLYKHFESNYVLTNRSSLMQACTKDCFKRLFSVKNHIDTHPDVYLQDVLCFPRTNQRAWRRVTIISGTSAGVRNWENYTELFVVV